MIHPVRLATTVAALCAMAMASAAPTNAPVTGVPQPSASAGANAVQTAATRPARPDNRWLLPTAQRQPLVEGDLSRSLVLADLTGDRTADIVTGNELSLTVGVVLSDRKGRVSEAVHYPIASAGEASLYRVEVAVGNLVGKRYPDIVAAGFSRDTIEVFVGQGAGRFAEPIRVASDLVGIEGPDPVHVGANVSGGFDRGAEAAAAAAVVEVAEHDRHVRGARDVIEA